MNFTKKLQKIKDEKERSDQILIIAGYAIIEKNREKIENIVLELATGGATVIGYCEFDGLIPKELTPSQFIVYVRSMLKLKETVNTSYLYL